MQKTHINNKTKLIQCIFSFFILNSLFLLHPESVKAAIDLQIDYPGKVSEGDPVFDVYNMLPGDSEEKLITITNNSDQDVLVGVKGIKTDEEKNFSEILDFTISHNSLILYDSKLIDFFNDSASDGIPLTLITQGDSETYIFSVYFPTTAGIEYENAQIVFNLVFGVIETDHLLINEVYYKVDEEHGFDSPKDRGILGFNGNNVNIVISDNADGSVNTVNVKITDLCKITQSNDADIRNAVDAYVDTGGNSANNTTNNISINTGFGIITIKIFNFFNFNFGFCNAKKLGQNHEWVEIYNPTDEDISLKNWVLEDNSGMQTKINSNKKIKSHGFALISKDSSVWRYWNEDPATKIYIRGNIGDGLGNDGDRISLINPEDETVDFVAWENDHEVWDPSVPNAPLGSSIERKSLGLDTDGFLDWLTNTPPTPGE